MKKIALFSLICLLVVSLNQSFACTTFLISGKYTADGRSLLFKNRDTKNMQNSLAFFNDGFYKYIGLVSGAEDWAEKIWGGYNEVGFAIINSAAYNNNTGDTSNIKDQEGVIMKLALQTCETLEDFEKLLDNISKPSGLDANFGVIDAYGGAAFYETGNYRFIKVDANDPKITPNGILVRTNYSFSGEFEGGYGYCRYNTAISTLNNAAIDNSIYPPFLINNISRNLYHSLTKTDLMTNIPAKRDIPEFRFFIDYIPRFKTSSAILIVGAKDKDHVKEAMMWTVLGFPLTSVAIPTWVSAGEKLPKVVTMNEDYISPLCNAALTFKKECFPITNDNGSDYINLSVVVNQQNNGYLQLLQPIENEIFKKYNSLMSQIEKGKKSEKDIKSFYTWIDQYLLKTYKEQFNIVLY